MPKPFTEPERIVIRNRLLAAARAALVRTGFRRTAVDDLCRAASISKGAFYLFFETKEALWMAVLTDAEQVLRASVRAALTEPEPLRRLLEILFYAVEQDPALRVLADADEMAWLTRSMPPGTFEEALADDDRFFREVHAELLRLGAVAEDVSADTFAGLAPLALAIAQGRALIGERRAPAISRLVLDGLIARLSPR